MKKKVFAGLVISFFIIALVFVGVWFFRNYTKITSQTDLYTYEEYMDYGDKRYQDGLEAGKDYKLLAETYLAKIKEMETEIEDLNLQITQLKADGYDDKERIEQLEADKVSLQNEVTRLENLLQAYENLANEVYEVSFYIQETLYTTKLVKIGNYVTSLEKPSDTNEYQFEYWTLDKVTEVDPLTIEITGNTTFYAVVTPKYEVKFVSENEVVATQYVIENSALNIEVESPTKLYCEFIGWSVDGSSVIGSTYVVSSDVSLYALFSEEISGFYELDGDLTYTWQQLLDNGFITVDGTMLTRGKLYTDTESFYGDIVIDDSITALKYSAFQFNSGLRNVVVPNTVTEIGGGAFGSCDSLESIRLSKNLVSMGSMVFGSCSSLKSIYIPASVISMENQQFWECSSSLIVYCGSSEKPEGWDNNWSDSVSVVKWGYTYEQYLKEINA